jgi:hypothetical protein
MSVSSLREFPENCVYKHGGLNCFIEYLHRKLSTANFLSCDIESAFNWFVFNIISKEIWDSMKDSFQVNNIKIVRLSRICQSVREVNGMSC